MTYQPEPCIGKRCYSPMACGGFGYCRNRNLDGVLPEPIRKITCKVAAVRKILDASLTPGETSDIVTIRMTKEQAAMLLASIELSLT